MTMWIALPIDDHGMWFDEPIGGYTKDEVLREAYKAWPNLPDNIEIVAFYCMEG